MDRQLASRIVQAWLEAGEQAVLDQFGSLEEALAAAAGWQVPERESVRESAGSPAA